MKTLVLLFISFSIMAQSAIGATETYQGTLDPDDMWQGNSGTCTLVIEKSGTKTTVGNQLCEDISARFSLDKFFATKYSYEGPKCPNRNFNVGNTGLLGQYDNLEVAFYDSDTRQWQDTPISVITYSYGTKAIACRNLTRVQD